jgi:hypothetical protein
VRTCPLATKRAIRRRCEELAAEIAALHLTDGTKQHNPMFTLATRGGLYQATLYAEDSKEYLTRRVNPRAIPWLAGRFEDPERAVAANLPRAVTNRFSGKCNFHGLYTVADLERVFDIMRGWL